METADKTFSRRRYEMLHHEEAGDIGRVALKGYERRRKDELVSGIAEALSGTIDTHYTFELKDGRFIAEDGEVIEDLLVRGLREDIRKASADKFFEFLPYRSRAELDNFRRVQAMARGKTDANTQLEISIYSEDRDISERNREMLIEAAQKPYWGRTMVRVMHWDGSKLNIITRSSDNLRAAENYGFDPSRSSQAAFKQAAWRRLGYSFEANSPEGMLAEPIQLKRDQSNWQNLAKDVTDEVDEILAAWYGGEWEQGRPKDEAVNLQAYVESQSVAVQGLLKAEKRIAIQNSNYDDYEDDFNQELYNCVALLEERLNQGKVTQPIEDYSSASAGAGAVARSEGRTYDMCGTIISPNNTNTAAQTGSESLARLQNKKVSCPECSKKVVVPNDDLEAGKMTCSECGYWLDVCTGAKGFLKKSAEKIKLVTVSSFDLISEWFKKLKHDKEIEMTAIKQAKSELGVANVTYVERKRFEKKIRHSLGNQ